MPSAPRCSSRSPMSAISPSSTRRRSRTASRPRPSATASAIRGWRATTSVGNRASTGSSEAIVILQDQPGRELAMAYSNQSQLHFLAQENDLAIVWGMRAIELATSLGDHEILAHALNNVGSAAVVSNDVNGFEGLEESLRLSLECGYQEHAARAYANIFAQAIRLRQYPRAERFLAEGLAYFQERDLGSWQISMYAWRARLHLEQG